MHLGASLRQAAFGDLDEIELVVHTLRSTGAEARRCLLALQRQGMTEFFAAWDYEVPPGATEALDVVWERLLTPLPVS